MIVGILSDSHGKLLTLTHALGVLEENGAEHFFHCGDIGDIDCLETLVGRPCHFVFGNTDYPTNAVRAFATSSGLSWPAKVPVEVALNGKTFCLFHGHEPGLIERAHELPADYVLHGHTHLCRDERVNGRRIINPGALHRAACHTVATLDLATDVLHFHEI